MFSWLWLHLLAEDLANQRLPDSILEDNVNRPWRAIPTKRPTPSEAREFLRATVWFTIGSSWLMGSFLPSVSLITMIYLYNDLYGSSAGPLERHVINAAALCFFGWGAVATLLGGNFSTEGTKLLVQWMAISFSIVVTTIQAQDFPDIAGDEARGRQTVPLIYGQKFSR
ncbi:uncharacterized protein F4822DRAFT_412425 [Hypoxylon trugodes]|uniref:uncharacterized protein n=1 Tax=Hypoxylon trugodes TaxID=326681 RepID=UPI0021902F56|nr:uncharacterized protein F4822DRAFT_412425 [Hypoxylon trugodes]KAI1385220.1 hypothetical protein F4822DRAFT_412425 [Hypoxylon trugodes]